jgi:hypothetical protein
MYVSGSVSSGELFGKTPPPPFVPNQDTRQSQIINVAKIVWAFDITSGIHAKVRQVNT